MIYHVNWVYSNSEDMDHVPLHQDFNHLSCTSPTIWYWGKFAYSNRRIN